MPKVPAYVRGFGLKKGMVIEGYTLTNIDIQHKKIILWQEYGYPTSLTWTRSAGTKANPIAFLATLSKKLSGSRVIYTAAGNAYRCSFGHLVISGEKSNEVIVSSHGVCKKIKKSEA